MVNNNRQPFSYRLIYLFLKEKRKKPAKHRKKKKKESRFNKWGGKRCQGFCTLVLYHLKNQTQIIKEVCETRRA